MEITPEERKAWRKRLAGFKEEARLREDRRQRARRGERFIQYESHEGWTHAELHQYLVNNFHHTESCREKPPSWTLGVVGEEGEQFVTTHVTATDPDGVPCQVLAFSRYLDNDALDALTQWCPCGACGRSCLPWLPPLRIMSHCAQLATGHEGYAAYPSESLLVQMEQARDAGRLGDRNRRRLAWLIHLAVFVVVLYVIVWRSRQQSGSDAEE